MKDEYQQACEDCGYGCISIIARYCPMCGARLRELRDFETPIEAGDGRD